MGKKHKNFVVFLDVDGVLNTRTTVQQTPKGYQGIDDARVEVLAKTEVEAEEETKEEPVIE